MSSSMQTRDIELDQNSPTKFLLPLHAKFLQHYVTNKEKSYEQLMVEYLKMSGIYWTTTALQLIDKDFDEDVRNEIIGLIKLCVHSSGGIQPAEGHDPHLLYTFSAIQILTSYGVDIDSDDPEKSIIDVKKTVNYIVSLQNEDGSFNGDQWGEVDVRFSFCAIGSLSLLKRLDAINLNSAIDFVMKCYNDIDGAFGCRPNSESHSGLIYCCLASLSIAGQLHRIDADQLGWWLSERQLLSGGLNGRPEKLPDLCYSWWVLSSLTIIGRLHWINKHKLLKFILACQDMETGGFADRPGNMVDPFHTLFGICGLSLLCHEYLDDLEVEDANATIEGSKNEKIDLNQISESIHKVNPVFCMLDSVIKRRGIETQRLSVL
ncbi:hypothetical protein BLOT_007499 [Blomia tropicalis]|nr:hypothetical protein BLOT_007499 [Blomia tropicalis]